MFQPYGYPQACPKASPAPGDLGASVVGLHVGVNGGWVVKVPRTGGGRRCELRWAGMMRIAGKNVDGNQSCEIGPPFSGVHVVGWLCISLQPIKQRLGVLQVRRVKPLGEPTVDRRQRLEGLGTLALQLP